MRLLWPGAFAFFLSFYLLLSALPLYARAAGVSDHALGFIIGAFALASMLVKPWAGWAADRFGRRPLMLAGASIFLAASLAYSLSGTAMALLLTRLLHGSGMGLYPTAASAVVTDLAPPERRGELLGFFGAAANVAMAIGPLAGLAIAERLGFTALFGVAAGVALVAIPLSAAVGETLKDRRHIPFGVSATLSRSAMFPSLIVLFLMLTYGTQVSFLPLYAHAHGVNPGLFFLVFALVVAVVRGRAGRLSDRLGRVPVTVGGLSVAALALLTLALRQDLVGLAAAGALYGVGFGSAQPALMAWAVDSVERHDRGRAMGTYYTALELGIATGAVGSGLAVSVVGFAGTFATAALMAALGAGLALGGTLRHGRRRA